MPQKNLLSFFSNTTNPKKPSPEISPVKGPSGSASKRRRLTVLDSDESSNEACQSSSHSSNFAPRKSQSNSPPVKTELNQVKKPENSAPALLGKSDPIIFYYLLPNLRHLQQINLLWMYRAMTPRKITINLLQTHVGLLIQGIPLFHNCPSNVFSVPYLALAKTFDFIEKITGRLKIIEILCNFFRSVGLLSPSDLSTCIYLCLNQLGPAYEGNELGVGETILLKALGATTGVGLEHLKATMKRQGDLGKVAESQTKKIDRISSLLVACRECEAKYLIRSLSGKLRIGLAEQTVLTALGQAACYTPFHSAAAVKEGSSRSGLLDAST
ncbi:unnamed protein product, partial [Echinostoma caproni]|uniref:DNA_ligase_A_N domain-containing protein n=1 Tax=Echinostoma caproni TaxID=27848 RepID=A0A183B6M3_9TREM